MNELDTAQTLSSSSPTFPERPYLTLVQGQDWRERLVYIGFRGVRGVCLIFYFFPPSDMCQGIKAGMQVHYVIPLASKFNSFRYSRVAGGG